MIPITLRNALAILTIIFPLADLSMSGGSLIGKIQMT
jgi:hypothetical protein